MTIIEGFRAFLLGNGTIASVVRQRIYPLRLPQKAVLPAIVLTRIDDINDAQLRGPNRLSRARIQVDCWAQTFDAAFSLGGVCGQRLDGYQGTWTSAGSPGAQIQVQAIFNQMGRDYFEDEILGGLCRQSTDYFVFYKYVGAAVLI